MTTQFYLTPAAGKKLIAKAVIKRPDIESTFQNGTIVVIMGTTNAFIANELLKQAGSDEKVAFGEFHRGVTLPPKYTGKQYIMKGDLVIVKGIPSFTDALGEVCAQLSENDIIIKGANAVNIELKQAAVLLGSKETGGTLGISLKSKAKKIFPVGVEKRVSCNLSEIEKELSSSDNKDLGLKVGGEPFTELDAVKILCGANARIIAGGGICGAEGGCYFLANGSAEQLESLKTLVRDVAEEPPVVY